MPTHKWSCLVCSRKFQLAFLWALCPLPTVYTPAPQVPGLEPGAQGDWKMNQQIPKRPPASLRRGRQTHGKELEDSAVLKPCWKYLGYPREWGSRSWQELSPVLSYGDRRLGSYWLKRGLPCRDGLRTHFRGDEHGNLLVARGQVPIPIPTRGFSHTEQFSAISRASCDSTPFCPELPGEGQGQIPQVRTQACKSAL